MEVETQDIGWVRRGAYGALEKRESAGGVVVEEHPTSATAKDLSVFYDPRKLTPGT